MTASSLSIKQKNSRKNMFFCLVVTLGFLWKVEWAIDMFSGAHEVGGRSKRRWPRINAPFPEFLDGEL